MPVTSVQQPLPAGTYFRRDARTSTRATASQDRTVQAVAHATTNCIYHTTNLRFHDTFSWLPHTNDQTLRPRGLYLPGRGHSGRHTRPQWPNLFSRNLSSFDSHPVAY